MNKPGDKQLTIKLSAIFWVGLVRLWRFHSHVFHSGVIFSKTSCF